MPMAMFAAMVPRKPRGRGCLLLGSLAVLGWSWFTACATTPLEPPPPSPIQQGLIGKTRQDLLACAGAPLDETIQEGLTLFTYYQEASLLEESFPGPKSSLPLAHHGCHAKVRLKDGRVSEVQYQSVPQPYVDDDHCDEIFKQCLSHEH